MRAVIAIGLLVATMPAQAQGLGWMSGQWCTAISDGEQTCETWSDERAGGIAGTSSTRKDGAEVSSERMRIDAVGGVLTFTALPSAAARPTRFALASRTATEVVFENRAHDYPQRVHYWRDGAALMAEVSLADGGRPMRWHYLAVQ